MPDTTNEKRLERRAKALMLNKNIPPAKMEVVRSIMRNEKFLPEEKYSAIIDLIKNCPDKKVVLPKSSTRIATKGKTASPARKEQIPLPKPLPEEQNTVGPTTNSLFIQMLHNKYRPYRLFKKRYLVYTTGRFHVGLKKRLVPARKLFKVMERLHLYQEKIMARLPHVMGMIIEDPAIEDPIEFNYLRVMQKWLMATPFYERSYESMKWLDQKNFEDECKNYIITFFRFEELDIETKEKIILLVENKLRMMSDLRKEEISFHDDEAGKAEKSKRNLKRETIIYEYMLLIRTFLSTSFEGKDPVTAYLREKVSLTSLPQLWMAIMEALVFKHELHYKELRKYYKITPPVISTEQWDYSLEFLKRIGKDPEAKRRRYLDNLRKELEPFEEIYSYIKIRYEEQDLLTRAFEDQWRFVRKRRQEHEYVYEEDFFLFIDECINYFSAAYAPLLNGSKIPFIDPGGAIIESSLFGPAYFEAELSLLSEIQNSIHAYRTNNPSITISRSEAKRIIAGKLQSMYQVETFIRQISNFCYTMARELHEIYRLHKLWEDKGAADNEKPVSHSPLLYREKTEEERSQGRPLPFYECKLAELPNSHVVWKLLTGRKVLDETIREGLFTNVMAFCYQLAYECFDETLLNDLHYRKELKHKIRELS